MIAEDVISHEAVTFDDLQPLATANGPFVTMIVPDGSTHERSPECTPASSMYSMMPPRLATAGPLKNMGNPTLTNLPATTRSPRWRWNRVGPGTMPQMICGDNWILSVGNAPAIHG